MNRFAKLVGGMLGNVSGVNVEGCVGKEESIAQYIEVID